MYSESEKSSSESLLVRKKKRQNEDRGGQGLKESNQGMNHTVTNHYLSVVDKTYCFFKVFRKRPSSSSKQVYGVRMGMSRSGSGEIMPAGC